MKLNSPADVLLAQEFVSSKLGKWYVGLLKEDYDKTIRQLLYSEGPEADVLRGKARCLHGQIKEIEGAGKVSR